MIAGFSAEMPALADFWRNLDTALADNLTLSAEVIRLTAELTATRLDRANLLAAMRATIAAHADGEPDPLYYLRDELDARQMPAQQPRGGTMTSYRQMRRHARQARRAGMQPMMIINPGDPLPDLAIVVIGRWAWRHRTAFAPFAITVAAFAVAACAHPIMPGTGCRSRR